MRSEVISIKAVSNFFLLFIAFICFFPTIRLLLVGGNEYNGTGEYLLTILPELFVLVLFILSAVHYKFNRQNSKGVKLVMMDWCMILFILTNTVIGFILCKDVFNSSYGFRVTYLSMLFYFIGRLYSIHNVGEADSLMEKLFKWFVAFAIIGLLVHFTFPAFEEHMIILGGHPQSKYFIARMTSLLWTPVLFGTLMAMSALYFYFKILTTGKKIQYVFFSIVWICLFLTVSRGPIIAFLLAFVFLSIFFKQWKVFSFVFLLMIVSALLISFILTGSIKMAGWLFTSTADTLSLSDDVSRVKRWLISYDDFRRRPWGYGLGKAGETAFRFFKDKNVPAAVYSTDGWYLKQACETGIYGLVSYLVISGIYLFQSIRFAKKETRSIVSFVLALFIMINAQNIVANTLDFHPFMGIYWLLIGFSVNLMQAK